MWCDTARRRCPYSIGPLVAMRRSLSPSMTRSTKLATAWAALADAVPNADLCSAAGSAQTCRMCWTFLAGATTARERRMETLATGFERLLLVQLETIVHRERSGAGKLGLDSVARSVDEAIATGGLPRTARELLASLRRSIAGNGIRQRDDPG